MMNTFQSTILKLHIVIHQKNEEEKPNIIPIDDELDDFFLLMYME